jgi:uncharacterized membrane protein YphA (DoxX/SURF4 family)
MTTPTTTPACAGGFLMLAANGPGRLSIDARRAR